MLKEVTINQAKDSGLALVLILLLLTHFGGLSHLLPAAMIALIMTMAIPTFFKPFAMIWFAFSHVLGRITSTMLLSAIFLLLVIPMALLRRLFKKDSMALSQWKKSQSSAFTIRNHRYSAQDLEHPF